MARKQLFQQSSKELLDCIASLGEMTKAWDRHVRRFYGKPKKRRKARKARK